MKNVIKPFKGLGNLEFGMTLKQVQDMVNIHESEETDKYLKETKVYGDKTYYVFNKDILVTFEMHYQDGVYFNDVDIFNTKDIEALLKGFKYETKKDYIHVQEIGMILMSFKKKDLTKRELWFYSKEMITELETFLDVV
ncbi:MULTISPECIES: hypothetical protein [Niastella]|uniref:DUF3908 domain-containing protein n=1 Tax=Niastella soli TaxID=2821487 RepID=A0ABS3Z6M1_9BACT|nr:hypothetical protein [Niastella soli]MBO9205330.1 hypothetical protein [Niastella soli]